MNPTLRSIASLLVACFLATPVAALAHSDGQASDQRAAAKEQKPWGIAGRPRPGLRTIHVSMSDRMRFSPDSMTVREGETVRFVVRNDGKVLHEFVLGTREAHEEHAALMMKFPNMEHDEAYMAHVAPGKAGEIVWTFNRPGEFGFACLVAGHSQAGMVGRITVLPKAAKKPAT